MGRASSTMIPGARYFNEPVHLLGMHNIVRKRGAESAVFQFGLPSNKASVEAVREFGPQFLGLSFIGYEEAMLKGAHEIIGAMEKPPVIMLGGPDVTFRPGFYSQEFGQYSKLEKGEPVCVVEGPGEGFIEAITSADGAALKSLLGSNVSIIKTGEHKTLLVSNFPAIKLNDLDFTRPYDLAGFNGLADVKWEVGCWGTCKYCSNTPGPIDYMSPSRVSEEVKYLSGLGAKHVSVASPNFTADPKKASEIMEVLPSIEFGLSIDSRVDSLFRAIKTDPEAWERFAHLSLGNEIDLGIESFIPERLVRIGKYPDLEKAAMQADKLDAIFEFFKNSKTAIRMYLMQLDWMMDLGEAELEARRTMDVLDKYGNFVFIGITTGVARPITFQLNSFFSGKMSPIDFFNFKKDPRLLFLYLHINREIDFIQEHMEEGKTGDYTPYEIADALLRYYLACIDHMKKVPQGAFNINPALAMMQQGRHKEVNGMLLGQLDGELKDYIASELEMK